MRRRIATNIKPLINLCLIHLYSLIISAGCRWRQYLDNLLAATSLIKKKKKYTADASKLLLGEKSTATSIKKKKKHFLNNLKGQIGSSAAASRRPFCINTAEKNKHIILFIY